MIFVTVGTQLPFDRLVRTVDDWAGATPGIRGVAQTGPSAYAPANLETFAFLAPQKFDLYFQQADLIVAHAGMGTILTALQLKKRLIVMPRSAALQEHRSDHQFDTVRHLPHRLGIQVAENEHELLHLLEMPSTATPAVPDPLPEASPDLLNTIRHFIDGRKPVPRFTVERPELPLTVSS
ncbi:MAG: glycosyltransferase [Planctomycetota bacterium]